MSRYRIAMLLARHWYGEFRCAVRANGARGFDAVASLLVSNQLMSGIVAIVLGFIVGVVLFVPFVARTYRQRGKLTLGAFVVWAAALVYFWAIWTYTLLPLPSGPLTSCAAPNLDAMLAVDQIRDAIAAGGNVLLHPDMLQLALNVLLFVPLGFFVRVLGGRGILVAGILGLLVSGFIETTQLTGVWGLYECAYRVFDVDDIITNTLGALIGSVIACIVPRRFWGGKPLADAGLPRPVSRGRRLLGMICDVLGYGVLSAGAGVSAQLLLTLLGRNDLVREGTVGSIAAVAVPAVVWGLVILIGGRSIGDLAVQLRYAGGPQPEFIARVMRMSGGVVGAQLVSLIPEVGGLLSGLFWIVALVLLLATRNGRGLAGLLSGRQLVDAREPVSPERQTTS